MNLFVLVVLANCAGEPANRSMSPQGSQNSGKALGLPAGFDANAIGNLAQTMNATADSSLTPEDLQTFFPSQVNGPLTNFQDYLLPSTQGANQSVQAVQAQVPPEVAPQVQAAAVQELQSNLTSDVAELVNSAMFHLNPNTDVTSDPLGCSETPNVNCGLGALTLLTENLDKASLESAGAAAEKVSEYYMQHLCPHASFVDANGGSSLTFTPTELEPISFGAGRVAHGPRNGAPLALMPGDLVINAPVTFDSRTNKNLGSDLVLAATEQSDGTYKVVPAGSVNTSIVSTYTYPLALKVNDKGQKIIFGKKDKDSVNDSVAFGAVRYGIGKFDDPSSYSGNIEKALDDWRTEIAGPKSIAMARFRWKPAVPYCMGTISDGISRETSPGGATSDSSKAIMFVFKTTNQFPSASGGGSSSSTRSSSDDGRVW